jgi:hypothetical protein
MRITISGIFGWMFKIQVFYAVFFKLDVQL